MASGQQPVSVSPGRARTLMDAAASDREAYYKLLTPAAVPVFIHFEGKIVFVNSAAVRALGAESSESVLGRSPMEFVSPASREGVATRLGLAVETQEPTMVAEDIFRRFDGTPVEVELAAWPIPYEESSALVVSFIDISERKRAEARQRVTEQQLQLLLNNLPGLVSYVDQDFRYRFANRRYAEWFGSEQDAFVGKTMPDVLGEAAFEKVRPDVERALRGESVSFDRYMPYKAGVGRDVHVNYAPDWAEDGSVRGVVVLVEDVGDRRRAEQALEASEQRYRAFVQQSSEGIWRFELDEPISQQEPIDRQVDLIYARAYLAECNDAMARMYGFSGAADLIGARLSEMMPRSDEHNERYIRNFLSSGYRVTNQESHELDREGNKKVFLNNLVGMAENGLLIRAWGTQQDITERKEMEEALLRANAELQQFAYAAAHDLQEPVRTIALYSQLLQRRYSASLDERGVDFLATTRTSAERMQSLIQDLLAYTKVADGKPPSEHASCDSNEAVGEVLASSRTLVEATGATVECGDLPRLPVRKAHMVQLIQNLLSNALKYRSADPPWVSIRAEEARGLWLFRVQDNGIGVPAEHHERIFKLFRRLHGRSIPGTGMGLAICNRIVGIYGGKIWVESDGIKGSCFCFTLPSERNL